MDDRAFAAILGQVGVMSRAQRAMLLGLLSGPERQATVRELLDGRDAGHPRCGHCGSDQVARWGSAHGLARHRCRACRRTSNVLTGTSLAQLRHRPQWLNFGAALQDGSSVRQSAKACGVAVSTAFQWRHRFLVAPTANKPTQLSGIVEADETSAVPTKVRAAGPSRRLRLTRRAVQRGGAACAPVSGAPRSKNGWRC